MTITRIDAVFMSLSVTIMPASETDAGAIIKVQYMGAAITRITGGNIPVTANRIRMLLCKRLLFAVNNFSFSYNNYAFDKRYRPLVIF